MKRLYIYSLLTAGAFLGGCSSENPFTGEESKDGVGIFSKEALNLEVSTEGTIKQKAPTRAENDEVNIDEFKIVFSNASTGTPYTSFRYADMPDIVELPSGTYTIYAEYGEDNVAAFRSPYYKGQSDEFTISPKSITSNIGAIKCNLCNVKTSVYFDPILAQHMDDEAHVEVKLGNYSTSSLSFYKSHSQDATPGYFKAGGETTIVATFKGKIDGYEVNETKTRDGVAPGNHYRFTFKLHNHKGETTGDVPGTIEVDASVQVTDVNLGVEIQPDDVLDDDERPTEDPEPGTEDPEDPTPPAQSGPTIESLGGLQFNTPIEISDDLDYRLTFKSETGFTQFVVDIDSNTLTPEELANVGLSDHLDLINPGEFKDALSGSYPDEGFDFPVCEDIEGQLEVHIDNLGNFMTLLTALGPGNHKFHFTISDASGTTKTTLILYNN